MRNILLLFISTLIIGACGTKKIIEAKPDVPVVILPIPLANEVDSISYAFGLNVAQTFKQIKEESDGKYSLDVDRFAEGIKDVLKDAPSESLADSLRKVFAGQLVIEKGLAEAAWASPDPLSDRERQILILAEQGKTNKEIAEKLHLSAGTVRNYLAEATQKLGANNRIEAYIQFNSIRFNSISISISMLLSIWKFALLTF